MPAPKRLITIIDYIERNFPMDEVLKQKFCDPFKMVEESDSIPYDVIGYVDGKLQKLLYLNDDEEKIPVIELLSYRKDDIDKMAADDDIRILWESYMQLVDTRDSAIMDIVKLAQEFRNSRMSKRIPNV